MQEVIKRLSEKDFDESEISLTCHGFDSVNWGNSNDSFEFIFGEDRVCCVHSVLAEFLGPKVSRLRKSDACCGFYKFPNEFSELFDVFEFLVSSLQAGRSVHVDKGNFGALLRISKELENKELASSLIGFVKRDSLNLDEAILLLREGICLGTSSMSHFESLREFVASHFHELREAILEDLDLETAQLLVSSPHLRIKDEDSLCDFVMSRCETDMRFASLFEFIFFEYLSIDCVTRFSSFVGDHLLANMNGEIWKRICGRLLCELKVEGKNPRVVGPSYREFRYDSSKPLNGIIAHLTERFHGNVHDKGVVEVTGSAPYSNNVAYCPKHAVDLGSEKNYYSQNSENSYLCYDFKERRVIPTSYSLRSNGWGGRGHYHPKTWVFEGSNDGKAWTELDHRDNNEDLNDKFAIHNFEITSNSHDTFRFIRLRQTGMNHNGSQELIINSMEIFGFLDEQ